MEKSNPLQDKSKSLALQIVELCKNTKSTVLTNQLLKSATSIGTNVREANYAHNKADFISKMQIALKECFENEYWIELLLESKTIDNKQLLDDARERRTMLTASVRTAKGEGK